MALCTSMKRSTFRQSLRWVDIRLWNSLCIIFRFYVRVTILLLIFFWGIRNTSVLRAGNSSWAQRSWKKGVHVYILVHFSGTSFECLIPSENKMLLHTHNIQNTHFRSSICFFLLLPQSRVHAILVWPSSLDEPAPVLLLCLLLTCRGWCGTTSTHCQQRQPLPSGKAHTHTHTYTSFKTYGMIVIIADNNQCSTRLVSTLKWVSSCWSLSVSVSRFSVCIFGTLSATQRSL